MDNKLLEDYLKGIKTTTSTNTNDFLSSYLQKPIVMTKPYVKPKSLLNEYLKLTPEQTSIVRGKAMEDFYGKQYTNFMTEFTEAVKYHSQKYGQTYDTSSVKTALTDLNFASQILGEYQFSKLPFFQRLRLQIKGIASIINPVKIIKSLPEQWKKDPIQVISDTAGIIYLTLAGVMLGKAVIRTIQLWKYPGPTVAKAIGTGTINEKEALEDIKGITGISVTPENLDQTFVNKFDELRSIWKGGEGISILPVTQEQSKAVTDFVNTQAIKLINSYVYLKNYQIGTNATGTWGLTLRDLFVRSPELLNRITVEGEIIVGHLPSGVAENLANSLNLVRDAGNMAINNLYPNPVTPANLFSGLNVQALGNPAVIKGLIILANTPPTTIPEDIVNKVKEVVKIKPTKEVPIKEVKPITSIKPVEILKTVPEVWKTENADVLVNKLDINQLRSLKSLFDKVLAGEKLTVSEKSVILNNHIMELNKETNKYELTIGEYQGKFLYDTIRGKIVRLQMTQKEIPAELKPEVKPPEKVQPPVGELQPVAKVEVPTPPVETKPTPGLVTLGKVKVEPGSGIDELHKLGYSDSQIERMNNDTMDIIFAQELPANQVNISDTGELKIIAPPVAQIPKELEPLAEEARKYPIAEEFVKKLTSFKLEFDGVTVKLRGLHGDELKLAKIYSEIKYYDRPNTYNEITRFYKLAVSQQVAKVKEKVPIVKEEVKVAEKPVKVYGKADAHFVSKAVSGNNIDTPIKLTGRYLETVKGTKVEGLTQDSKSHWFFKKNILNPEEFSEYARWGALPDGKEVAVYYAGVEQFGKEFKVSQLNLSTGAETKSLTTEEITEHISKSIDPHEKVRKQLMSALKKMKLLKPKPNAKGVWIPSVDMQAIMKRYFPKETLNGILNSENETQTLMEIIDGMNKVKEATGEDIQLGRVGIVSVVQSEWRTVQEVFGDYKLVDRTSYAGVKIIEYLNDANGSIQKLYKETINPVIKKYKINKADLFDILRHPERFPDLSQEVKDMAQKVITWNKVWQEDMADKLNIPQKYRIENHIFYQYEYLIRQVLEDPQGDKSLPQSLLHGIADYKSSQPLAEFEDPALKKRTQEDGLGMIKDFYKATMANAEYGIRKYYLDPILNDMKKLWGKLDLKTQVHFKRWISEDLVGKTPYMEGLIRESGGKLDRLLTTNLKKIINPKTHQPIFKGEVKDAIEKLINITISATYMAFLSLYPKTAFLQFFQKTAVVPLVSGYGFTFATKNWLNPKYRRFVSQNSNVYKLRKVERLAGMEESTRNKFLRILQNVTMFLFNMFDTDGVTFAFIAGYGEAKHYGLSEEVSIARGEEVARQSMYIYTKMFRSELARNVLGRAASMFTSFPINFAGLMSDLLKGNVSNVYKKHFKEHPEELTGNRGKLVKKNYAGLIKYLLMLIGASLLQKKTRVRITKYIGIDALFGLFNYNAAAFNVYKYAGNALYYLLVDWDPKKALAEFNKLSPSDQISLLRTLQYLGVYGNKKDIWNAILYMNKLPTIKIMTPPGRTTRKGER